MSRKLSLVVILASALAVAVVAFSTSGPVSPVSAADCGPEETGTLIIHVLDIATDKDIDVSGAVVLIEPDPEDFQVDTVLYDVAFSDIGGTVDKDPEPGVIRFEGACSTGSGEFYEATLYDLPSFLQEDCEIQSGSDSTSLDAGETEVLTVEVDCTGLVAATATAEASATVGPASNLTVIVSTLSVGCGGTSVVTVQLRDAGGQAVGAGVPVNFSTNLGSVNPSSGVLTAATGNAFAFYSAPSNVSGVATVTATSGSLSDTGVVTVNCGNASATVAPQATSSSGGTTGTITPPNTGSGGLINP